MKTKALISAILLLGSMSLFAVDYVELFNRQIHLKENFVLVEDAGLKKIVIPFHFNKTTTDFDSKNTMGIDPRMVRNIEYIYYENSSKSHQEKLNSQRIDTLLSLFGPKLKNVDPSAFNTIILSNEHVSRTQFTGFVITTEMRYKDNKQLMKDMLEAKELEKRRPTFTLDTLDKYGYVLPHLHQNLKAEELNVVAATFARNKNWKNKLIVVDVTGSMTPYLCQYLLWLNLNFNQNENQSYVFFNDGNDNKGFNKKEIGATGGLYFTRNSNGYSSIEKTINIAMVNGGGGDCPENNVEALLAGEKKFSTSGDVILIADNNASPRDLILTKKLKKPVHIILCGVRDNNLNVDYLNLARKTKGSIHTIENDLTDLIKKKEGDTFTFLGAPYVIKNGEIAALPTDKIGG
jgi:hypothetical protein